MVLVAERAARAVSIVEDDRDCGLGNPGLALLVDEFLEIGCPNLLKIGDSEDEADRVEDVRLSRAVKPGYGVEEWVEPRNNGPRRVRLETFQAYLF